MAPKVHRFQSFDVAYDILVDDGGMPLFPVAALREVLPPRTRSRRGDAASRAYALRAREGRRVVIIDGGEPLPCPTLRSAQDLVEGDLALYVAASAPKHVFIHAGVVGWRGRALLLPGRTFTGKSTLVNALVACGATYYSDEYAVLDADGSVLPYARRMSLRQRKGLPRRMLPEHIGRRALAPGWVVGSRFDPERKKLAVEPLSRGRAALLLLDNAVAARIQPARVLQAVRKVSEVATGAMIVRGDARTAAKQLLLLLAAQGSL